MAVLVKVCLAAGKLAALNPLSAGRMRSADFSSIFRGPCGPKSAQRMWDVLSGFSCTLRAPCGPKSAQRLQDALSGFLLHKKGPCGSKSAQRMVGCAQRIWKVPFELLDVQKSKFLS